MIRVTGNRMVMVEQSLIRAGIAIVTELREIEFTSNRIITPDCPEGRVYDKKSLKELRRLDGWLKKAKAVLP